MLGHNQQKTLYRLLSNNFGKFIEESQSFFDFPTHSSLDYFINHSTIFGGLGEVL